MLGIRTRCSGLDETLEGRSRMVADRRFACCTVGLAARVVQKGKAKNYKRNGLGKQLGHPGRISPCPLEGGRSWQQCSTGGRPNDANNWIVYRGTINTGVRRKESRPPPHFRQACAEANSRSKSKQIAMLRREGLIDPSLLSACPAGAFAINRHLAAFRDE